MTLPIALSNLFRRPLRTGLTILGIAIAAATYVMLASTSAGLEAETESVIRSFRIDLVVQKEGIPIPWNSRIAPEEVERLRGISGVATVSPVVIGVTKTATRPRFYIFGASPATLETLGLELSAGRLYAVGKDELLVGADAAREQDLKPGDRVAIAGRREFNVVGVFRTGRRLVDGGVAMDLPLAQQAFRLGNLSNLAFVTLAPGTDPEKAAAAIGTTIPELEATPAELFAREQKWLQDLRQFGRALAILALVIATLGVSNTLSMNVAGRTGEIGLLRAIGWRRGRIARLVVFEGLLLALGGAAVGLPAASVLLSVLSKRDYLGVLPARLPLAATLEGIGTLLLAGLLASLPPLVHALRIRPARALREL